MAARLGDLAKTTEALNGSPGSAYHAVIQSTGSSTKNSTAFVGGEVLVIQPDGAGHFLTGTSSVSVATSGATRGVYLDANEKFYLILKSTETHIAWISSSGTTTLYIYKLS